MPRRGVDAQTRTAESAGAPAFRRNQDGSTDLALPSGAGSKIVKTTRRANRSSGRAIQGDYSEQRLLDEGHVNLKADARASRPPVPPAGASTWHNRRGSTGAHVLAGLHRYHTMTATARVRSTPADPPLQSGETRLASVRMSAHDGAYPVGRFCADLVGWGVTTTTGRSPSDRRSTPTRGTTMYLAGGFVPIGGGPRSGF